MNNISSKDKLINATIEAVYTSGLYSVTTAKIAKIANLSEAMIYKHFENKDKMIIQAFMEVKAELNSSVESKITKEMDFDTQFCSIWQAHVDYFIQNPKNLRVINQIEHSNFMTDEIRSGCLKMSKSVMTFFQSGIEQQILKPMHIEVAIALFFSPILSIAESIIDKRIDKSEELFDLCFKATMDALKVTMKR